LLDREGLGDADAFECVGDGGKNSQVGKGRQGVSPHSLRVDPRRHTTTYLRYGTGRPDVPRGARSPGRHFYQGPVYVTSRAVTVYRGRRDATGVDFHH